MSGQGWPRACRTGLLEEEGPRVDSEELTRAEQEGTWGGGMVKMGVHLWLPGRTQCWLGGSGGWGCP